MRSQVNRSWKHGGHQGSFERYIFDPNRSIGNWTAHSCRTKSYHPDPGLHHGRSLPVESRATLCHCSWALTKPSWTIPLSSALSCCGSDGQTEIQRQMAPAKPVTQISFPATLSELIIRIRISPTTRALRAERSGLRGHTSCSRDRRPIIDFRTVFSAAPILFRSSV